MMQETESHDLSEDAASQRQGTGILSRSNSSIRSEAEGYEVVYSKDNVSVHPTQSASERISGRLKLIKQGSSLLLS